MYDMKFVAIDKISSAAWGVLVSGVIGFAFVLYLQYVEHLPPCALCVWQRVFWGLAMLAAMLYLLRHLFHLFHPALCSPLWMALSLFMGAGVAFYHGGVENGWFGSSCAAAGDFDDIESLRQALLDAPLIKCDEILWQWQGLSLADINLIVSLALGSYVSYTWRNEMKTQGEKQ